MRTGDSYPTSGDHIQWLLTLAWIAVCCLLLAYVTGI